jgi:hypothetical protein
MSPPDIPISEGMTGANVAILHRELTRLGLPIETAELRGQVVGPSTLKAIRTFQASHQLEPTGIVDRKTAEAIAASLGRFDPAGTPDDAARGLVRGRVITSARTSVPNASVATFDVGLGREQQIGQGAANAAGEYALDYDRAALMTRAKPPDLRVRASLGGKEIGASEVVYNSPPEVTIDVIVAPELLVQGDEHTRIVGDLTPYVEAAPDRNRLGDLVETPERRDITYLANKTGWDARAVAMAAAADQMSQGSDLPSELFYALFRAGVPANRDVLARTRPEVAAGIWKQSIKDGVINRALARSLPDLTGKFAQFAAGALLKQPAPIGVSSLDEVLNVARLDADQKQRVATAYATARDLSAFWSAVDEQIGAEAAARVANAGRLGYLTVNNAPLMRKLAETVDSDDPVALVRSGLYDAAAWRDLIDAVPVPGEIPGADEQERKQNYADLLSSQLQISYPTAVVAAMVDRKELPLADERARGEVAKFLADNQGDFELGEQPVERFLRERGIGLSGRALAAGKTLQRQYQLSPSNQTLKVLASNRLDSAYAVTRYSEGEFVGQFAESLGGEETARVVYAKSQQVHAAAFNIATAYLMARTGPSLYSVPATLAQAGANGGGNVVTMRAGTGNGNGSEAMTLATADDVLAYATLEQLFGELDYCTCSHCRSVLSPAAYLVDLLLFCDKRRFNASGQELPADYDLENPLDVLLSRRPDIAELQLSCENTNVALPYVDLVNEVLEHFVVNKSLTDFAGHDVEPGQTSEELTASPRFTEPAAYTTLAGESYPLQLPFHRALAGLRAYIERVGTTLADTMEALRKSDALVAAGGAAYGWRDILIERLGIIPGEYTLLTDSSVPLAELYGEDAPNDDAVIAVIGNAKTFARRLDLDYDQVVELTRTRFVNPQSWLLPRLDRLGVSFETIRAHHDGDITDDQLDARLPTNLDTTPYGGDPKQWLADHYDEIGSLIVLRDPDGGDICSFDDVRLQHALSGAELTSVEALRMLRFVRLWRRLGWTIDQTDRTLAAVWPAAQRALPTDTVATGRTKLDTGFAEALLRIGHLRGVMDALDLNVKRDLPRALALWAPIDAVGPTSLYHTMFLASSIVDRDPAFAESSSGEVLTGAAKLVDHRPALEAAFNLKGGELDPILDVAGFDDQTDLTLDNVSTVFRWAFLARRLKLAVRELVALTEMTGLDPFDQPASPRPPLVRLLDVVDRLRDAGVRVPLLMYLLHHDLQRGAPEPDEVLSLAKRLHDELARIEQENTLVDDPSGDVARAKMALVYGQPTADRFMGLVTGTVSFDVPYAQPQPTLDPTVVAAAPGLSYDHLAKRLSNRGLLSLTQRNAVQALAAATPALSTAVGELHTAGQDSIRLFFEAYPELATLYDTVMAGPAGGRTASVLGNFLPDLRRRLQELQLLQALASDSDLTPADLDRLLRDPAVLHKIGDANAPALDDMRAIARSGASMAIYDGATVAGNPSTVAAAVDRLDYATPDRPLPANSANPAGKVSGVWRWRLDPPANGFYSLSVDTDGGADVELRIDDRPVTMAQAAGVWETQDPIELKAGELAEVRLTVENVRDRMVVRWQSAGQPREVIPADRMLPADLVDSFAASYTRLLKALSLAAQLGLDGEELAWFATRPALAIGGAGWLNSLPVASGALVATVQSLFTAVLELVGYAQLRRDLKVRGKKLLELLRNPAQTTDQGISGRAALTGWPDDAVAAVLVHLGLVEADLSDVDELRRVKRVLDRADEVGVPPATLLTAVTNDPTQEQLASLQSALRARYDEDTWYNVVQPVNDGLRDQQRDALVAYVLHHLRSADETAHIDTANKLFEWFLIDVEMEPCMKTSRIRQALSSVQLFIQRCLLNLEPRVAASSIDARRWSWMQRYRVWEANRKVFLMPENWLEPELRDDKSPLFKQLESDLLGADITDESAARALGRYLTGLTEVAKLEVDGMFVEEHAAGAADDIVHVVGRTAGARRKYFYRRQSRGAWTAWEPIPLDIEDTPVIPVVWRGRLFLFWLRVLDGSPRAQSATTAQSDKKLADVMASEIRTSAQRRMVGILQWSEHFNGAWQPSSTSDPSKPIVLQEVGVDAFDRAKLKLSSHEDSDGSLVIGVTYDTSGTYFRLYTPHSVPVRAGDEPTPDHDGIVLIYSVLTRARDFRVGKGLSIDYVDPDYGKMTPADWFFTHDVLRRGPYGRVVEPRHVLTDVFGAPFFYEDRRHVLYVRPAPSIIRVPNFSDLGVQPEGPTVQISEIPLIELIPQFDLEELIPKPGDPYPPDVYRGGFEVNPVGAYVRNRNIRTGIGAVGTFTFGDQVIAPGGAVQFDKTGGVFR